jgi:hypothetical protein
MGSPWGQLIRMFCFLTSLILNNIYKFRSGTLSAAVEIKFDYVSLRRANKSVN